MSKKRVYYKVMNRSDRTSFVRHPAQVTYPVKEWAKPIKAGHKLMVLKSMKNAEAFRFSSTLLVPCYIKRSKKQPNQILEPFCLQEHLSTFWKMVVKGNKKLKNKTNSEIFEKLNLATRLKPEGTVFADEVFCLE